jgi:hypothetical protein
MNRVRLLLLSVAGGLIVLAWGLWAAPVKPKPGEQFHKELLQAAKDYKSWGRVDGSFLWAPVDCRMPDPAQARFSASDDDNTHGQKLYSLFAKDPNAYLWFDGDKPVAVGQVVVKESWVPEETTEVKPDVIDHTRVIGDRERPTVGDHFYPYATRGDKVYKAGTPAGLFIMMKLDPKTEGTDDGWVYGTVSAEGKQVTAAGKIESCMKCHQEARHDRLFGLAK